MKATISNVFFLCMCFHLAQRSTAQLAGDWYNFACSTATDLFRVTNVAPAELKAIPGQPITMNFSGVASENLAGMVLDYTLRVNDNVVGEVGTQPLCTTAMVSPCPIPAGSANVTANLIVPRVVTLNMQSMNQFGVPNFVAENILPGLVLDTYTLNTGDVLTGKATVKNDDGYQVTCFNFYITMTQEQAANGSAPVGQQPNTGGATEPTPAVAGPGPLPSQIGVSNAQTAQAQTGDSTTSNSRSWVAPVVGVAAGVVIIAAGAAYFVYRRRQRAAVSPAP